MKPFKHQKTTLTVLRKNKRVFDTSDAGCVSADTEFLTPTGWKRIDQYVPDDTVAQFHPESREIEFVTPTEYIKRPCETMIAIAPVRGTSQRLSPEHRVLFYRRDGSYGVKSAQQFMTDLHRLNCYRSDARFCATFNVRSTTSLDLSDMQIRLMVAVIADGHFHYPNNNRCVIRIKKERKKTRLQEILIATKTPYKVRQCGGQPEFDVFTFKTPRVDKEFSEWWWSASQHQLEIIADEVCYWDSAEDPRPSNGTRFSTFVEASANFVQYAFSAAKRPSSLTFSIRDRRAEGRGMMIEYTVHACNNDRFIGPGRPESVYVIANPEGFKYCFEVPSSFLLLRHNGYIFATGNTGKTLPEILDIADRRKTPGAKATLVVASKSLLQSAWGDDIEKFCPTLTYSIAWAENRAKAFDVKADVYITNHDAAKWLSNQPKKFFDKFDALVIDESSAYKHHTSQRSRAMAKIVKYFEHRRLMSGTPSTNGICDIWHQMLLLDDGKRLGRSFFAFRSAVCVPEQVGPQANMLRWIDKPNAEAIVSALIQDVVVRHKFEDCVDIPPNHQYSINFYPSAKHMRAYKELEQQSVLAVDKKTVTAINGAVLYGKLLQVASGAVYGDEDVDGNGSYTLLDTTRYEMVIDLVAERTHSVVFFYWKHQKEELMKAAEKRGLRYVVMDGSVTGKGVREEITRNFQAGFYDVIFAHPKSAAHGLTWTKGVSTIFASVTPNLEWYLQGMKRIYRIGQTERTETIMIVAPGTFEERAYASLTHKGAKQTTLLDYLQEVKAA